MASVFQRGLFCASDGVQAVQSRFQPRAGARLSYMDTHHRVAIPPTQAFHQAIAITSAARNDLTLAHMNPGVSGIERLDRRHLVQIDDVAAVDALEMLRGAVVPTGQKWCCATDIPARPRAG